MVTPSTAPLTEGALFAGHVVQRLLESDGAGQVYLVSKPGRTGLHHLRIVSPNTAESFLRDAAVAATLSHPNIAGVHDHGEYQGRRWIVTEHIDGTDLGRLMRDRYPTGMPIGNAITIVTAVANALDYAHGRGLPHRGVTPATIIIGRPDERGASRILLTDFAIAPPTAHTDQYALAATAYYLFTGTRLDLRAPSPLPGEQRPDLRAFDWVFATALADDPDRQFSDCRDFAQALAGGHLAPAPAPAVLIPAPAETAPIAPPARKPRRRRMILLVVLAVLALVAGGTVVTMQKMHAAEIARQLAADREGARLAGQHYLEALAGGDAAAAVALAAEAPTDNRFLTNDILRSQLAAMPITDIAVTNAPGATAGVEPLLLSAKFGAVPSQVVVSARKVDGEWRLDAVTVPVTIGTDPAAKDLRIIALAGVSTAGAASALVFPGAAPPVTTTNQYVDLTADVKPVLLQALTDPAQRPAIIPNITLNDAGREAALEAVERFQESCYTGERPSYRCCPTGLCSLPPSQNHGIDSDTIRIISRDYVGDMTYALDPSSMQVAVNGVIRYSGEAQVWGSVQPITFGLSAKDNLVDLLRNPPEKVS